MSSGHDRIRLALDRGPGFRLDVDLELPARGITVLFGPSGSGKTTLLRCVAGLERAAGEVHVAGTVWQDATRFLPTWRRPLGYVFQEASLFPHLTVAANLSYAQRRAGRGTAGIAMDRIVELLALAPLLQRPATQLSGGERQRVAIARALATGPQLLLLDEPLAALDPARRREVLPWLEGLRANLGMPMLYVTHSAEEMARLADTVVLLDHGRVRAAGAPGPTLARLDIAVLPEDDAGALLDGRVGARDDAWHLVRVDFDGGALWVRDDGTPMGSAARVRVLARDVSIATEVPAPHTQSIQNLVRCTVRAVATGSHPSQAMVQLDCGRAQLMARITARAADQLSLAPGMEVWAQVKSAALLQ